LIVDDDKTFRLGLAEGLTELEQGYHILVAGNGSEAVDVLNAMKIDLVITDLKMPVMDGFELVTYIRKNFPELPSIVITAFGTPEIETGVKQLGAIQYAEKPIDFDALIQKISDILSSKSHGFVRGISLPSFLHLIELENKTCTLTIQAKDKKGFLYFMGGVLINAETGDLSGKEAAMTILAWETGEIEIDGKNVKKTKKIDLPLNFIILEAMRRKDESSRHNIQEPGSEDSRPIDLDFDINKKNNLKENQMKSSVLNAIVESIKSELGAGLLATDVWMASDGQALAGFNSQPKACALFNKMTEQLKSTLERSNFPTLGEFYLLKLADGKIVVIVSLGDFRWGILADSAKVQLGLLINIVVPNIIDSLKKGIEEG
jgi:CheY-like chemotaxis protein